MIKFLILILIVSCSVNPPRKDINNELIFHPLDKSPSFLSKNDEILSTLTPEEETILINGYFRLYQYVFKSRCGFKEDFSSPGTGVPKLGILPLKIVEISKARTIPESNASFIDLRTLSQDQKYHYLGRDADFSNHVFFNSEIPPERKVSRDHKYDLLLLRTGIREESKIGICAININAKNYCTIDEFTPKVIKDFKNICSWLKNDQELDLSFRKKLLLEIIGVFRTIRVIK